MKCITGSREYHVQFFGDAAERGWISKGNLLEFKGQAEFSEYSKEVLAKAKSKKEIMRLKKWYQIPANRKKAVEVGIAQAEIALPLTRNERKLEYTFTYELPKPKKSVGPNDIKDDLKILKDAEKASTEAKPAKKRKHSEIASPAKTQTSKKQKVETSSESASPIKSPAKKSSAARNSAASEGSFEVFCQKERENVLDRPDFTDDMLMDYCRQQWCMMSKKQKARYKTKYSEETGKIEKYLLA